MKLDAPARPTDTIGLIALGLTSGIALIALVAWALSHVTGAASPAAIAMPPTTAVALVICGFLVRGTMYPTPRRRVIIGATLVGGLAGLSILEYLAGWHLPIDLAPAGVATVPFPGRMSPIAAFLLLLAAAALVDRARHGVRLANGWMGVAMATIATLNLLDILYGAVGPQVLSSANRMTLDATVGLLVVGFALVATAPIGLGRVLVSSGIDGLLGRRLIVAALIIPPTVGWLRLEGERLGLYDTGFGVSVTVLSTIGLFLLVIWWTADAVHRVDALRHVAERRLRIASVELERSNRELQDFAAIASHDLQEPLRKIQAFGDRLNSQYAQALGEAGSEYLGRMTSAATRMRDLIDDLLAYSKVQSTTAEFRPVALQPIMDGVLQDLERRIEECGGRVEVGPLPSVAADPTQMRQLLQNLVGNALKFKRAGEAPHVRVTSRRLPDAAAGTADWEISVADNGIGFEPSEAERIFAPFQRLHGRGDYEGTGIGLAICRRIVERHGGVLVGTGIPGEGATFTATLPDASAAGPQPATADA